MGTGLSGVETTKKIEQLCQLVEENYAGEAAREMMHVITKRALCKSFLRQGVMPYSFLEEIATAMQLEDDRAKGQFIEDVASVCQLTGPDLLARSEAGRSKGLV